MLIEKLFIGTDAHLGARKQENRCIVCQYNNKKVLPEDPKSLGTIPAEFQGLVWGKTALLCTTRFNVWSPQKKEWMNSGTKCLKKRVVGHRRIFSQPPVCSYPREWQTSDVQLLDPQCQKALTVPHCWHRKNTIFCFFCTIKMTFVRRMQRQVKQL